MIATRQTDDLIAEQLRAVDAVVLAQHADSSAAAAPRVAAYLPKRAQDVRVPTARHM